MPELAVLLQILVESAGFFTAVSFTWSHYIQYCRAQGLGQTSNLFGPDLSSSAGWPD